MLEFTFHPPIFALAVVNRPVDAAIVVMPETDAELNVSPDEFNMYPAPVKDPPESPVAVTVLPPIVPLYIEAPVAILILPLNEPFLALRSPSMTNDVPFHSI